MNARALLMLGIALSMVLSGCLTNGSGADDPTSASGLRRYTGPDDAPFLGYLPAEPDLDMPLLEFDLLLPGFAGIDIHARVVRPEGDGPFPVIVQHTPYTAPGRNVILQNLAEPVLGPDAGTYVEQFVRRGYAYVHSDARGTGDSSGCLDLRGDKDIADLWEITEYFGTQPWSNGKVGFIGASYPGSESHMAALANNPHLGAVIPVVASTSFYHYHHNDGVPYNGNHALGGTNAGYTQTALSPTVNPQSANYATRWAEEANCPHYDNIVTHGGMDQSGAYYDWWQERNLRARASSVQVPVLMAQGLADWNVKPDHIATWFNDLNVQKTLIAGQWGHQFPRSQNDTSDCVEYIPSPPCDPNIPWGDWWAYATAFFDTYLKGIDTGMFGSDVAWVQDNAGAWHRSPAWPLPEEMREGLTFHIDDHSNGRGAIWLQPERDVYDVEYAWFGCPNDTFNRGTALSNVEEQMVECDTTPSRESRVFETAPFERDVLISGVPLLRLTLTSESDVTHITAVLERRAADGTVVNARENYGYLNPTFRNGLDNPEPIRPGEPYVVTLDFYPQEDLVKAGEVLRLTLASDDGGRTIEAYTEGTNTILVGPENENWLYLPLRPLELQGVRLT